MTDLAPSSTTSVRPHPNDDQSLPSVGIDLGGTHLRAALYLGLQEAAAAAAAPGQGPEPEGGGTAGGSAKALPPPPAAERREGVGERRDPDTMAERIAGMVEELLEEGAATGPGVAVGIGVAGMPRGREGFIVRSPHLGWTDVPFGDLLSERMGRGARIRVVNDVNAITYGEFVLGAGMGTRDVLAVYVGTGIGGGLVTNGLLVEGSSGCAGEIGHFKVVLGPDAKPCACGNVGCVEAYAGGRILDARIRADLEAGASSIAVELAGGREGVTVAHLDEAASRGDAYALGIWNEVAPLLGATLANAVSLLNPERLILGGGVFSRTPWLRNRAVEEMQELGTTAAIRAVTPVDGKLGEEAGMIGAALLAGSPGR